MSKSPLKPDTSSFNCLIGNFAKSNPSFSLEVYERMKQKAVKMDKITYHNLMKVHAELGNIRQVQELFESMKAHPLTTPDVVSFTILISATSNKDPEYALKIFQDMTEMNLQPDAILYNALIQVASRAEKFDLVHTLWNQLLEKKINPSISSFSLVMNMHANQGNTNEVYELFKKIPLYNLKPNSFSYSIVISAFAKARHAEKARELYEEMQLEGIQPNTITSTSLLSAYAHIGQIEELKETFSQIPDPSAHTFSVMLMGLCNGGNPAEAVKLFHEIPHLGTPYSEYHYTVLIEGTHLKEID